MSREFVFLNPSHPVDGFFCGETDLRDFLIDDALSYQQQFIAQTYLIFENGQLAAYFALAADSIVLEVDETPGGCEGKQVRTYPALKLARLATDPKFEKRGIGSEALEYCVGAARSINESPGAGCRFVTVDALPSAEPWYARRGFVPNLKHKNRRWTRSMRLDVLVD